MMDFVEQVELVNMRGGAPLGFTTRLLDELSTAQQVRVTRAFVALPPDEIDFESTIGVIEALVAKELGLT